MKYETGTISNKGVVVIPKAVRDHMNIEEGDKLEFVIRESGTQMYVIKKKSVLDVFGIIKTEKGIPSMTSLRQIAKEAKFNDIVSERKEPYE